MRLCGHRKQVFKTGIKYILKQANKHREKMLLKTLFFYFRSIGKIIKERVVFFAKIRKKSPPLRPSAHP